jgi:multidrug efflux pump subunit AcrB
MLISAVNAMTMTPARAAWIFASRDRKDEGGRTKDESKNHPSPFILQPSSFILSL